MPKKKKSRFHYCYSSPPDPCRRVGYCKYHKWFMTARTLKIKGCLEKQCRALRRYNDHPYWGAEANENTE